MRRLAPRAVQVIAATATDAAVAWRSARASAKSVRVRPRPTHYLEALVEAGIACDPALVRHALRGIETAEAAAHSLLASAPAPTALFAGQDLVTIGAIRALRSLGLEREIAVVGFDNFLLADLLDPAVTVVAQDSAAMGALAAEILFRRMDGDDTPAGAHLVPTTLVVRGSGEIAPRDPGAFAAEAASA